jgi:hypothetical protein
MGEVIVTLKDNSVDKPARQKETGLVKWLKDPRNDI